MKANSRSFSSFFSKERFHSYFYLLTYRCKIPPGWLALLWLLEKAMVLTTVMICILNRTPWASLVEKLGYLNILSYFVSGSSTSFIICCVSFAAFLNVFIIAFCIRLACHKSSRRTFWETIISLGFPLISRVYIQNLSLAIFYLIENYYTTYVPNFAYIPLGLVTPHSTTHLVLTGIMSFVCAEAILISAIYYILHQSDAISLWSINYWRFEFVNLLFKLVIYAELMLGTSKGIILVIALMAIALLVMKIAFRFLNPLPFRSFYELTGLGLDSWLLMLQLLIVFCEVILF